MAIIKKLWPIKSDTSCYLKWSWSTVYLNKGTTASCHRTMHLPIKPGEFNKFHNLPKKVQDRERMLQGLWPNETPADGINSGLSGCSYCQYIENKGGVSDRMIQLRPGLNPDGTPRLLELPHELDTNPTAVEVTPTILEVYFNNVCNMACLYCGPHFSTMWEEENRRFDTKKEDGILVNPSWIKQESRYYGLRDELFEWLNEYSHRLFNFGMLGGEPFIQEEFEMMLDHFETHPNPELMFTMTTNLKIPYEKLVSHITRIKRMIDEGKIGSFNLSASMDCWGPQVEYVRWGLDLEKWSKNFAYLAQHDWLILNVNFTITPLTIHTLPDLIERLNEWDAPRDPTKHICHSFMHVLEPTQLDPRWFGPGVFAEDFERILAVMPTHTAYLQGYKEYMRGIGNAIEQTTRDPAKVKMLEDYLIQMDSRRGTNWREVFPWLIPEFDRARQELGL